MTEAPAQSRLHPVGPSTWKSMGWRYGYRGIRIPSGNTFLLYTSDGPALCSSGIIGIAGTFEQLLCQINRCPGKLRGLHPRQFEAFVAEIWKRFGYVVELTARTRDGGRDVIAVKHREVSLRFLIECKHFDCNRKVGVAIVRSLYGVKMHERATKAILATTSSFTKGALDFLAAQLADVSLGEKSKPGRDAALATMFPIHQKLTAPDIG